MELKKDIDIYKINVFSTLKNNGGSRISLKGGGITIPITALVHLNP